MLYIHIQKKIIQFLQSSKIKIKNENLFYIIDNDIDIFLSENNRIYSRNTS